MKILRVILAYCLLPGAPAEASQAEIAAAAQALIDAGAAGLAMALIDEKGASWKGALGYTDLDQKKPMTADTLMNIASISKTVTATSVMMLVEKGLLDLDRDINHYLSFSVINPRFRDVPITTRQLLTHSSSIIDREAVYASDISYYPGADNPLQLGEFLKSYLQSGGAHHDPANFAAYAPGTAARYSNIGAGLAGYLVEVISGLPLNEFSARHIFEPLAMDDTGWMLTEIDAAQHASLYQWTGGQLAEVEWYGLVTWPDGGLRSSVNDLSRFYAAMMGKGSLGTTRIMQEETVELMFTPQFVSGKVLEEIEEEPGQHQALTWNYRSHESGPMILGHSGSDPGVRTFAYFYRESRAGAILLVNTSSDKEAFRLAFQALVSELLKAAPGAANLPASDIAGQPGIEGSAMLPVSPGLNP